MYSVWSIPAFMITSCAFLAYILFSSIYVAHTHLSDIPGPVVAPYSRIWMLLALISENCNIWYYETNRKYGKYTAEISHITRLIKYLLGVLARIGPNHLLTSDPDIFRQILNVRSEYERGSWFDCLRLNPYRANLITERDRVVHNQLRRQMAAGVSIERCWLKLLLIVFSMMAKG
jgi:hypothetical protein